MHRLHIRHHARDLHARLPRQLTARDNHVIELRILPRSQPHRKPQRRRRHRPHHQSERSFPIQLAGHQTPNLDPHLPPEPTSSTVRPSGTLSCTTTEGLAVMSITASEARKRLFPLIKKVNEDHDAIEIVSKHGNAVLVSAEDYAALREGAYLLRSPANARRLLKAYENALNGVHVAEHDLIDSDAAEPASAQ